MAISKVIYGGKTLIDLTPDTVIKEAILKGYTAHGADGEPITGTCTFDADTQDATATESEILVGKIAYNKGNRIIGKMPSVGAQEIHISDINDLSTITQGYHDGSGYVDIAASERAKLIPENIRDGVTILNVEGNMSGSEDVKAQSKSVTPKTTPQTVLPDTGYTHLTQVTVAAIPYVESDNSAGGKTVTIA